MKSIGYLNLSMLPSPDHMALGLSLLTLSCDEEQEQWLPRGMGGARCIHGQK